LAPFYWAADVGVWPKQESTSQLDAAACGLPLIVSNRVAVVERVTGNGLLYDEADPDDLARKIVALDDPEVRQRMSAVGVEKVQRNFSWRRIAAERIDAYQAALGPSRRPTRSQGDASDAPTLRHSLGGGPTAHKRDRKSPAGHGDRSWSRPR